MSGFGSEAEAPWGRCLHPRVKLLQPQIRRGQIAEMYICERVRISSTNSLSHILDFDLFAALKESGSSTPAISGIAAIRVGTDRDHYSAAKLTRFIETANKVVGQGIPQSSPPSQLRHMDLPINRKRQKSGCAKR